MTSSLPPLVVRLGRCGGGAADAGSLGSHAVLTTTSLLLNEMTTKTTTATTMTAAAPHTNITATATSHRCPTWVRSAVGKLSPMTETIRSEIGTRIPH